MPEDLDIVVTGFEVEPQRAEAGLMRVFGLDSARARRFVEQLPVVAKRCNERSAAERYATALRSIGARVELRDHIAAVTGADRASLPAPDTTQVDQLRTASASERAIARFRKAEGLDEPQSIRMQGSLDLYNPVIPKAPPVPHDLRQMPNGPKSRAPAPSPQQDKDRPDWVVADPLALTPERDGDTPASLRPSDDDQIRVATRSSTRPGPRTSDRPRSIGIAHAATASVRPGLSAHSLLGSSLTPRRKRFVRGFAIVTGAIAIGLVYGRSTGMLSTDDERHTRAWREQGIEAGEHAPAKPWLEAEGHRLHGFDDAQIERLLEQLERAGTSKVFVIGIKTVGQIEEAGGLLVEMPAERSARRTVLWHLAAARGEKDAPLLDGGERFQVLELP